MAGKLTPAHHLGRDENLRTMADCEERLLCGIELPDEALHVTIHADMAGRVATGDQQGVEILSGDVGHQLLGLDRISFVLAALAADLQFRPFFDANDGDDRPGRFEGETRLDELGLFKSIANQRRDASTFNQLLLHETGFTPGRDHTSSSGIPKGRIEPYSRGIGRMVPRVVQPALRFDGTAAKMIEQSGIGALRKRAPNRERVEGLPPDKIVQLSKISVGSHRAVPLNLYYKAAKRLLNQADSLTAEINALERHPQKLEDQEWISRLKTTRDELEKDAHVTKLLGYARRTRLQHLMAKAFPKDRRETYLAASVIFSFVFNLLWIPIMVKAYLELSEKVKEAEKKKKGRV